MTDLQEQVARIIIDLSTISNEDLLQLKKDVNVECKKRNFIVSRKKPLNSTTRTLAEMKIGSCILLPVSHQYISSITYRLRNRWLLTHIAFKCRSTSKGLRVTRIA